MSFYKEQLAEEKDNYIHIRAATDEATVIKTLRLLADETLACIQQIELLIGKDSDLKELWHSSKQVSSYPIRYNRDLLNEFVGLYRLAREDGAIPAGRPVTLQG